MTAWIKQLEQWSKPSLMAASLGLVAVVGAVDYFTGFIIFFSAFYLIPVTLAAWFVGRLWGNLISLLCVAVWLGGDYAAGAHYSTLLVPGWNGIIALTVYFVVVKTLVSLHDLRNELEERVRQRTVALTNEMQERSRLEKELIEIGERGQRQIGHDLHDGLGQHLTATAFASQVLAGQLENKALPESAAAQNLVTMVEEAINLTRTFARGLQPVEMEPEGLTDGFQELTRNISERFRISCEFECREPMLLHDATHSTHLYRIAQEAITNAIKHGKARFINVSLEKNPDHVLLAITDDGVGLPRHQQPHQGMGLRIMAYRAGMIGAVFNIERLPDAGTRVTCRLPLNPETASKPHGAKIKILLVDDHPLVREWLTNLLNQQPDFTVCGETGTAPEALQRITALQPDVAVVDISLASGSGIELIKDLKARHSPVAIVVLSMHDEMLYAERALRAGAGGYIMKSEATQKVIQGIRAVLNGEIYVSPRVASSMAQKFIGGRANRTNIPIEELSDRELEVFQLLGCGYSTRQISEHLHVGFKTVQGYSARIKEKLNLTNINELMREAIRWQENQEKTKS